MTSIFRTCTSQVIIPLMALLFATCHHDPASPDSAAPQMVDYFPLKVGNKWTYAFTNIHNEPTGYGMPGIWKENYQGISTWEIVSVSSGLGCMNYTFEETITGSWIRTWNPPGGTDTLTIKGAKFKFVISDSASYMFGIQFYSDSSGSTSPNAYLSSDVVRLRPKRFLSSSSSVDTARYRAYDFDLFFDHVYLVRSIGICEFAYSHGSMSSYRNVATLQSSQLK